MNNGGLFEDEKEEGNFGFDSVMCSVIHVCL